MPDAALCELRWYRGAAEDRCDRCFVFSSSVPAQPSSFEAEAEQDDRIMLTWLYPVQDAITKYELTYWESGSGNKVCLHPYLHLCPPLTRLLSPEYRTLVSRTAVNQNASNTQHCVV